MELAVDVHAIAKQMPREEQHVLRADLLRASVSIAANIAEAHAREERQEWLHHISVARGSLARLETLVMLAGLLHAVPDQATRQALLHITEIGRLLSDVARARRGATASGTPPAAACPPAR